MIVYHGSTLEVKNPDVSFSKDYLDFGKGFYVTSYLEQAENWAYRKHFRQEKPPVVNIYTMQDMLEKYKVLSFKEENEQWLDFVGECRQGSSCNQSYDIIIGRVANDDVFKTLDLYFRGFWTKEQALSELRYYKSNDQMCFVHQEVLKEVLSFQESYQVGKKYDE